MSNEIAKKSFKITCAIEKAFIDQTDGPKRMFIQGRASGTKIDRQGERMSASVITAFQKAIETGIIQDDGTYSLVPLVSNHRVHGNGIPEWDAGLGWLTKAWVDEENDLWVEAELDADNPDAHFFYRKLTRDPEEGKPVRLGLSIGGRVIDAGVEWDDMLQEYVPTYYKVALEETSVTSRPAYPTEYLTAIGKSVDWDRVERSRMEDHMKDEQSTEAKVEGNVIEKNDESEATPTETVTKDDATPATESVTKTAPAEEQETVQKMADEIADLKKQIADLVSRIEAQPAQAATTEEPTDVTKSAAQAEEQEAVQKTETATDAAAQPSGETVQKSEVEVLADTLAASIKEAVGELLTPIAKRLDTLEAQEVDGSLSVSKAIDGKLVPQAEDDSFEAQYERATKGIDDVRTRIRTGLEAVINSRSS